MSNVLALKIGNEDNIRIDPFCKLFSVFMAIYPVLCLYKGVSSFTIGDIILVFCFIFSLIRSKKIKVDIRFLIITVFLIYAFLCLLVNQLLSNDASVYGSAPIWRIIKLTFYFYAALVTGSEFLSYKIFKKTFVFVALLACVFLFIQYVGYYTSGHIFLGRLPGLSLYLGEYAEIDYSRIYSYQFRPSSFFLEPAMFVQYVSPALIITLFGTDDNVRSRSVISAIILSTGIVLSTAAQGYLYLAVIFFIFASKKLNKTKAFFFLIGFIVVIFVCYKWIPLFNTAVNRLLFSQDARTARLGSYDYCFSMDGLKFVFGNGYGVTPNNEYMPGMAYVWYGCGLLGLVLSLLLFVVAYYKAHEVSKVICILFFIMFLCTGLFYNYMVYWYYSLIMGPLIAGISKENQT